MKNLIERIEELLLEKEELLNEELADAKKEAYREGYNNAIKNFIVNPVNISIKKELHDIYSINANSELLDIEYSRGFTKNSDRAFFDYIAFDISSAIGRKLFYKILYDKIMIGIGNDNI